LPATDLIHEYAADEAAWQEECIDRSAEANSLRELPVWVETGDDRRTVYAEGIYLDDKTGQRNAKKPLLNQYLPQSHT
jgi:hypothetical protein